MSIEVKLIIEGDLTKQPAKVRRAILFGTPKALKQTAALGRQIIKQGLKDGKGIEGKLKPYSKSYLKFRAAKKRRRKGRLLGLGKQDPATVNLNATGQMLRSMQVKSDGNKKAVIFFDNAQASRKAFLVGKARPFLGFNSSERERLGKLFARNINVAFKRAQTS